MDSIESGDEDYHIFKQDDLFSEALPIMKEIRRQGKLCDVKLNVSIDCFNMGMNKFCFDVSLWFQVEDQSFSAHRIVLASTIPYFYAMFTHDMTESRIREIKMKEIEPQ